MEHSCVGVPSAVTKSGGTYHENKDSEKMIDLTFLTKGQLRKSYELLHMEHRKLKSEKTNQIIGLRSKVDELSGDLQKALKDIIYYQEEYQKLFDQVHAKKREEDPVNYLKVAI